jgi:hypothetical protein
MRAPRIALWDQYGGSMESGWTRWILEQFEFPFTRVSTHRISTPATLNAKYDVLILPTGAIPRLPCGWCRRQRRPRRRERTRIRIDIPAEYRGQLGRVTADKTIPQTQCFVENGGTVVALSDSAMNLAQQLKLPVENHLVENGAPFPRSKFFVPGSVLTAKVDVTHPLAAGMTERTTSSSTTVQSSSWDSMPRPQASAASLGLTRRHHCTAAGHGAEVPGGGVPCRRGEDGEGHASCSTAPRSSSARSRTATFKLLFNAIYQSAVRSLQ